MYYILLIFGLCLCAAAAGAQTDDIRLPDVVTNIEGTGEAVSPDALPEPVPVSGQDGVVSLPRLDSVVIPPEVYESEAQSGGAAEDERDKTYIDAIAGGGYPGVFTGSFSFYRPAGKSPFNFNFSHESVYGYGRHTASEGYYDSETVLSGEGQFFISDRLSFHLSGGYRTVSDGMQGKSSLYQGAMLQKFGINSSINWALPSDITLQGKLDGVFANQFLNFAKYVPDGSYTGMNVLTIIPGFSFGWSTDTFSLRADALYTFDSLFQPEKKMNHRGDFSLTASYELSAVQFGASAGAVVSSSDKFLFPFSAVISVDIPDIISASVKGGLKTSRGDVFSLLYRQPYLSLPVLPGEESDWFASASVHAPVLPGLYIEAAADFAKTAFGNGLLVSDYEAYGASANTETGLFSPVIWDRTSFVTSVSAGYTISLVTVSGGWRGHWFDVNRLTPAQQLFLRVSAGSSAGKWGADAGVYAGLDWNYIPEVNISGFYEITKTTRLSAEIVDVLPLIMQKDRKGAGPYIMRGCLATVKVRVFL